MDSQKFDELVATLSTPARRRAVLKGVGAAAAAGAAALLGRAATEAAQPPCRGQQTPCPRTTGQGTTVRCCPRGTRCVGNGNCQAI